MFERTFSNGLTVNEFVCGLRDAVSIHERHFFTFPDLHVSI